MTNQQTSSVTVRVQMQIEDAILQSMPYGKSNWITMHDLRKSVLEKVQLLDASELLRAVRSMVKKGVLETSPSWEPGFRIRKKAVQA